MKHADEFFAYARERYRIHLRRTGSLTSETDWTESLRKSGKWTCDHILQQYRFCNVFREDDKTTKYLRDIITLNAYGDSTVQAWMIARWFNRIETIERLLPPDGAEAPFWPQNMLYCWDEEEVRRRLAGVSPIVTAAYMVKTPAGMTKLEGLIQCIEQGIPICREIHEFLEASKKAEHKVRLKTIHAMLLKVPYLGPFMAYEIVTDLRHTPLLDKAPDINTWASPGPGAARGAGRVEIGCPKYFNRHSPIDLIMIDNVMLALLKLSRDPKHWPAEWPRWEMREVEHTLCEFDKYERARLGEGRPKQKYDGGLTHGKR